MSGYHPSARPLRHAKPTPLPPGPRFIPDSFSREAVSSPPGLGSLSVPAQAPSGIPGLTWSPFASQPTPASMMDNQASTRPSTSNFGAALPPPVGVADVPMSTSRHVNDTEEAELEGVFEDLYEPYDGPAGGRQEAQSSSGEHGVEEDDNYMPPEPGSSSSVGSVDGHNVRNPSRSRSYSPFLSPMEAVNPPAMNGAKVGVNLQAASDPVNGTSQVTEAPISHSTESTPEALNLREAKKTALASILRLWPHHVRYQDYVDEGVDESVVKDLFLTLGLEAKAKSNTVEGSGVGEKPQQAPPVADKTMLHQTPAATKPVPSVSNPSTKAGEFSQAEERKDRIARLLAEKEKEKAQKAAKRGSPTASAFAAGAAAAAPVPSGPGAFNQKAKSSLDRDAAQTKSKLLQQKLEALQKSRAGRRGIDGATEQSVPVEPTKAAEATLPVQSDDAGAENAAAVESSSIPGLFLSSSAQSAPLRSMKRPVAADFSDMSPVPAKRPFGQERAMDSLIIQLSDDDDDEDMDGGAGFVNDAQSASLQRTTSFRDHPPLSDRYGRRQLSTPIPTPATGTPPAGKTAAPAKLDDLNQNISEMRKKIAEAEERRKLAKTSRPAQSSETASSNGESAPEKPEMPEMRRTSSPNNLGQPNQLFRSHSGVAEPQMVLPKAPQVGSAQGLQSMQKRIPSETLPSLEATLIGKRAKLRLLKTQEERLQKEIQLLETEKAAMKDQTDSTQGVPTTNGGETGGTGLLAGNGHAVESALELSSGQNLATVPVQTDSPPTPEPTSTEEVQMSGAEISLEDEDADMEQPDQESRSGDADLDDDFLLGNSTAYGETKEDEDEDEEDEAKPRFHHYESVLKDFKSYRFHPNFTTDVAGGLRSLTYSNKIDPQVPFCRENILGEECPRGAQCQFQHLEKAGLSDQEIILELGDARKLTGDEHQRYIDGLRTVLSQLPPSQNKDFGVLSRAIIDYRVKFFGDTSRILPLGDVSV